MPWRWHPIILGLLWAADIFVACPLQGNGCGWAFWFVLVVGVFFGLCFLLRLDSVVFRYGD